MEGFDLDQIWGGLGPLWAMLATWQNAAVLGGTGAAMEVFKRGPLTKVFATSRYGQVLAYYAPVAWAWLLLFLPIGLSAPEAGIGHNFVLGLVLGMAADSGYDWMVKSVKKVAALFFQRIEASAEGTTHTEPKVEP